MIKDKSILKAVQAIDVAFGPRVQIADHWEGLLYSIGFQVGDKLFYIDSLNQADGFYDCMVEEQLPEAGRALGIVSLNELVEMIRQQLDV